MADNGKTLIARYRRLLVLGCALLLAGLASALTIAHATMDGEETLLRYTPLALTIAGFLFTAGGWVTSVMHQGKLLLSTRRILVGEDECSGLVAEVQSLRQSIVPRPELLNMHAAMLDRWEERFTRHEQTWRDELEHIYQEMRRERDEHNRRLESALQAMQSLTRTVGQAFPPK